MNIEAVETDSCVLVQIINSGASIPWRITSWAAEIKCLLLQMHASIVHVVREGNQPADRLANHGCLTMPSWNHPFFEPFK